MPEREIATSRLAVSSHNASETEIVISHAAWIAYQKLSPRENVSSRKCPSFLTRSYFFQRALFPLFTSQEFPRQGAVTGKNMAKRIPFRFE